jgi:penicillin-binding protein 1B
LLLLTGVGGTAVFTYFYVYFAQIIDRRLRDPWFANASRLYAAPEPVYVGQEATLRELAGDLRRAGYSEARNNRVGWYSLIAGGIQIFPGPESYFQDEPVLIRIANGAVERIVSLKDNTDRQSYELEPQIITNLFDRSREKRRLIRFEDLPPHLVNAITSVEDKSFFQHSGIDFLRVAKAAYNDLKGERLQGASTLTMQLAGGFFLNRRERTWKRKLSETLITLELEQRLTKPQIFEFYMNQVSFGQRGSFSINGVGEAAVAYFGKDVKHLSLPEAALLAGILNGPSLYSPYRWPDRAKRRRDLVLEMMFQNGAITAKQKDEAMAAPLGVVPPYVDTGDAPYFVDLVKDQLVERYSEKDLVSQPYRIYTTLDSDLQRMASEAIRAGIQEADNLLAKKKRKYPQPQVALVCLDPHTGEVKALQGGRNYGLSQLNRAISKRQPGSSFKPFVYAAAFNSAIDGSHPLITPATVVVDEPTVFTYDNGAKTYEPDNYMQKFAGPVTLRSALAHSYNIATVKVAEMTGYEKVAKLATEAGLKDILATPAMAIGSYDATPLEMAAAYTIFANRGEYVGASLIRTVKAQDSTVVEERHPTPKRVLDPRVAYLMTSMMENVMIRGTAASVRSRGFTAPAAGKTGSSHDAWFAGYTTNLLTVVWVGFDDNTNMPLEGAKAALPIWVEFMKRAVTLRRYRNPMPFQAVPGVVSLPVDPETGMAATAYCPNQVEEIFIETGQPEVCYRHRGGILAHTPIIGRLLSRGAAPPPTPVPVTAATNNHAPAVPAHPPAAVVAPVAAPAPAAAPAKKKPGFWGRLFGAGSGPKEKAKPTKQNR